MGTTTIYQIITQEKAFFAKLLFHLFPESSRLHQIIAIVAVGRIQKVLTGLGSGDCMWLLFDGVKAEKMTRVRFLEWLLQER